MNEIVKNLKQNIIVCGHFGCGKTNVAVGLALGVAAAGLRGALVDLDIINPFFRAADAAELVRGAGLDCIIPPFANTNADLPSLGSEVYSVFTRQENDPGYRAVIDVGGESGAAALGRYFTHLSLRGCSVIYVANKYRPLTSYVGDAPENSTDGDVLQSMREIEFYSRQKISYLINNSNLGLETTTGTVESSLGYADEISQQTGIPLLCTTVHSDEIRRELSEKYPRMTIETIPDSTRRLF